MYLLTTNRDSCLSMSPTVAPQVVLTPVTTGTARDTAADNTVALPSTSCATQVYVGSCGRTYTTQTMTFSRSAACHKNRAQTQRYKKPEVSPKQSCFLPILPVLALLEASCPSNVRVACQRVDLITKPTDI